MRKIIRIFLLLIACLLSMKVKAQTAVIDSLEDLLLEHNKQDTVRVKLLNETAGYLSRLDSEKSFKYAEAAGRLAEETGYLKGKAVSLYIIGIYHRNNADYPRALEYFQQSLEIHREIRDKLGVAKCLNDMGITYLEQGNYPKAFEYYQQALIKSAELGDKQRIALIYKNIGMIYDFQGNYSKAIEFYEKAMNIQEDLGDKSEIAKTLYHIGIVHSRLGNYSKAIELYEKAIKIQEELDSQLDMARSLNEIGIVHSRLGNYSEAISTYIKSLRIQETLGSKFDVADILNNIGEASLEQGNIEQALQHLEKAWDISYHIGAQSCMARSIFLLGNLYMIQGEYALALQQFEKTLKLHTALGEIGFIARDHIKIGETHFEMGYYADAIMSTLKGLEIARETDRKEDIKLASLILAKCYSAQQNFKDAYQYQLLYQQISDSILTKESQKKINALELRFELEGKEKEIELQKSKLSLQQAEIDQQRTRQKSLLGGLVAVLIIMVLAGIAYFRIRTANKKITELDEFKQGLTAMIVHDLKNPLNAILSQAQKPGLKNAGKQMLHMVLNILDVQKFEETKMILKTSKVLLSDVAERAIEQVSFLSQQKNITIQNSLPSQITVRIDPEIVERIFINLLTNGIKYSSNSGNIHLSAKSENFNQSSKFVRIEVSDMGVGIPADKLDRVFDKFGQVNAKSSGRIRSSGMGLTFCKLAVEAHGGTIGVRSDIDHGTAFWFTLPRIKPVQKNVISTMSGLNEKQPFILTQEDRKYLAPFVRNLRNHEVYEVSSLHKIIKDIDSSKGDRIKIWKEELLSAIESGNKEIFSKLLKSRK
ncbi:DUF2225 domain-containing protein [bacterium]|nr:DUF2225 domain-containing protein [bacterium]